MPAKNMDCKFRLLGPGGLKCACCAPPPGLVRKKVFRAARRVAAKVDFSLQETWAKKDDLV